MTLYVKFFVNDKSERMPQEMMEAICVTANFDITEVERLANAEGYRFVSVLGMTLEAQVLWVKICDMGILD